MEETDIIKFAARAVILVLLFWLFFIIGRNTAPYEETIKHDTTTVVVAIHDTVLPPKVVMDIRVDDCLLAIEQDVLGTDSPFADIDSITVEVPIEQRVYETENYRAVIEGFRPELISMDIFQKQTIIETTKTQRKSHWSVGLALGPGVCYSYTPAGWQPGAGVALVGGVTFSF